MEIKHSVLDRISEETEWNRFLQYKLDNQHLSGQEENLIRKYIEEKRYIPMYQMILEHRFPGEYPVKKIINKEGTQKKRVVYSFSSDISITLKFIAYQLYEFDEMFSLNCYAFRRNYGVGDALKRILRNNQIPNQYCLKADISNYFNSIQTDRLRNQLAEEIGRKDEKLFRLFETILLENRVVENGRIQEEQHGAMAGIPLAPFFANIYLMDVDAYFMQQKTEYFRYSDDILLFADSYEELMQRKEALYTRLAARGLMVNQEKECIAAPGNKWEFLGFSYDKGQIDLSENTKRKIKGKIHRKADALRRWQRKKELAPDKAAIGFIRAMNRKFYGNEETDEFTWSRWFFPNLTVDYGLKEIDRYMQEYIRYTVTGRHYRGNYRISYQQLKDWGYRGLVHEYYNFKKERKDL